MTPLLSSMGLLALRVVLPAIVLALLLPDATLAQSTYPNPLDPDGSGPDEGVNDIPGFLALVLEGLSLLLMPLVIIFIIYAGYLFVTAQGEEAKISKARATLMYAIIGAAVILGARIMADILADTLTELNQP
jgi:hypothetical protein